MKIEVSFLKSKYDKITTIKKIEDTNCDFIHVDVMDGIFVNNQTEDLTKYLKDTKKKLDVHLMCENPLEYIDNYKTLNVEYITIHLEINHDINKLLDYIHSLNIKTGLSLNPKSKIEDLKPYLDKIDQILIMSVTPGEGGQEFIPESIDKILKLQELKEKNNYNFVINIDGGVNEETIKLISNTKIDMIVSGSYICMSDNYQEKIDKLKELN